MALSPFSWNNLGILLLEPTGGRRDEKSEGRDEHDENQGP